MATALNSITTAIDFSAVITAVGTVGVAIVGVYMMIKGIKIVLGMLRSA
jgi:hypothetical protein